MPLSKLTSNSISTAETLQSLSTGGVERIRIDNAGNMFINANTTTYGGIHQLTLTGLATYNAALIGINSYDGYAKGYMSTYANAISFGSLTNVPVFFTSNNAERMRIDASGNIGIGRTDPAYRFDIAHGSSQFGFRAATNSGTVANDAGFLTLATSSATAASRAASLYLDANGANGTGGDYFYISMTGDNAASIGNQAGGDIRFYMGNTTKLLMTNGLYTYDSIELTALASGDRNSLIDFVSSGNALTVDFSARAIRTPGVNGEFQFLNTGTGRILMQAGSAGVQLTNGATAWASASDERLKTNLTPITNAVSKVSSLRAVTGRYIEDSENISRAFLIAQDVQSVLPEAVSEDINEDKTLSLRYTDVIPLLVAAIKELKAEFDEYKATHP